MKLNDKDVGEIWKSLNQGCLNGESCVSHGNTFALIRKLVEERGPTALDDFGIDPQTWKEIP